MIVSKPLFHPHAYGEEDKIIELDDFDSTYVNRFVGGRTMSFPVLRTLTKDQYIKLTERIRRAK